MQNIFTHVPSDSTQCLVSQVSDWAERSSCNSLTRHWKILHQNPLPASPSDTFPSWTRFSGGANFFPPSLITLPDFLANIHTTRSVYSFGDATPTGRLRSLEDQQMLCLQALQTGQRNNCFFLPCKMSKLCHHGRSTSVAVSYGERWARGSCQRRLLCFGPFEFSSRPIP